MFEQLVESRPPRTRSTGQMLVSIAVHTVIIAVSIQLTRAVARPAATEMLLTRPPIHIETRRDASPSSHAASPAPLLALPTAPLTVPAAIPPIDLGGRFDTSQFDLKGRQPAGPPGERSTDLTTDPHFVATLAQADDPAVDLEGPLPVYPSALRQVGIEGSVQLRYIVGVDGRAESGSVKVTRSTNTAFELPATEAIRLARFRPARIGGRVVRQVVEQVVRFTLGTRG